MASSHARSPRKVLIIIGDATETLDTLYPYYRLQEAHFEPVVAAPEKRRYQMGLHEVKPGWTYHDNGRFVGQWIELLELLEKSR